MQSDIVNNQKRYPNRSTFIIYIPANEKRFGRKLRKQKKFERKWKGNKRNGQEFEREWKGHERNFK